MIDLIKKYEKTQTAIQAYEWAKQNLSDAYEGPLFVNDTISFLNGMGIPMKSKIIGFDDDGGIYLLWDCYWSPIRTTEEGRDIKKIESL